MTMERYFICEETIYSQLLSHWHSKLNDIYSLCKFYLLHYCAVIAHNRKQLKMNLLADKKEEN